MKATIIFILFIILMFKTSISQVVLPNIEIIEPDGTKKIEINKGKVNLNWQILNDPTKSINYLKIEFTSNYGNSWNILLDKIESSKNLVSLDLSGLGKISFKFKLSSVDNLNIYSISNLLETDTTPLPKVTPPKQTINLLNPVSNDIFSEGDKINIFWDFENIDTTQQIIIQYSTDFGNTFKDSTDILINAKKYTYTIPNDFKTELGKIKISLKSDRKIFSETKNPVFIKSNSNILYDELSIKFNLGATFNLFERKVDANSLYTNIKVDIPLSKFKLVFNSSTGKSVGIVDGRNSFLHVNEQNNLTYQTIFERNISKEIKFQNFNAELYWKFSEKYIKITNNILGKYSLYLLLGMEYRNLDISYNIRDIKKMTITGKDTNNTLSKDTSYTRNAKDDYTSIGPGIGFNFRNDVFKISSKFSFEGHFGSTFDKRVYYSSETRINILKPTSIVIGLDIRGVVSGEFNNNINNPNLENENFNFASDSTEYLFFIAKQFNISDILSTLIDGL